MIDFVFRPSSNFLTQVYTQELIKRIESKEGKLVTKRDETSFAAICFLRVKPRGYLIIQQLLNGSWKIYFFVDEIISNLSQG